MWIELLIAILTVHENSAKSPSPSKIAFDPTRLNGLVYVAKSGSPEPIVGFFHKVEALLQTQIKITHGGYDMFPLASFLEALKSDQKWRKMTDCDFAGFQKYFTAFNMLLNRVDVLKVAERSIIPDVNETELAKPPNLETLSNVISNPERNSYNFEEMSKFLATFKKAVATLDKFPIGNFPSQTELFDGVAWELTKTPEIFDSFTLSGLDILSRFWTMIRSASWEDGNSVDKSTLSKRKITLLIDNDEAVYNVTSLVDLIFVLPEPDLINAYYKQIMSFLKKLKFCLKNQELEKRMNTSMEHPGQIFLLEHVLETLLNNPEMRSNFNPSDVDIMQRYLLQIQLLIKMWLKENAKPTPEELDQLDIEVAINEKEAKRPTTGFGEAMFLFPKPSDDNPNKEPIVHFLRKLSKKFQPKVLRRLINIRQFSRQIDLMASTLRLFLNFPMYRGDFNRYDVVILKRYSKAVDALKEKLDTPVNRRREEPLLAYLMVALPVATNKNESWKLGLIKVFLSHQENYNKLEIKRPKNFNTTGLLLEEVFHKSSALELEKELREAIVYYLPRILHKGPGASKFKWAVLTVTFQKHLHVSDILNAALDFASLANDDKLAFNGIIDYLSVHETLLQDFLTRNSTYKTNAQFASGLFGFLKGRGETPEKIKNSVEWLEIQIKNFGKAVEGLE